jgi:3-hydroxyisobutyrate dehydrogenase-like beta-hydroxyacid dehydrogenase
MHPTTIGLLHPGEMGAAVGACLTGRGHQVLWAAAGRGPATAARAQAADLADAGTAGELARRADVIVSVCPPHAALDVARAVAGVADQPRTRTGTAGGAPATGTTRTGPDGPAGSAGFRGVYLDANAISPGTAREVARIVTAGGASYVDGGIIGPPPTRPGSSRLYLSGPQAPQVAALLAGTALTARVIGADAGAASAVKMAYAAWTKGTAALLLAAQALARAEGVEEALLAEWAQSQPALAGRSVAAARSAAGKGWRWAGEMDEIAASMAAAGLPAGFHEAAAGIFRRVPAGLPGADEAALDGVIGALLGGGPGRAGEGSG